MKFELRKGNVYTSHGIRDFLESVLRWLKRVYDEKDMLIKGDSVFTTLELYTPTKEYEKEAKLDFEITKPNHSRFNANHAKAMILTAAYNIINIMKKLVTLKELRKSRMLSIRYFFIKIACRAKRVAMKMALRGCSSYPYKDKLFETMHRIDALHFE